MADHGCIVLFSQRLIFLTLDNVTLFCELLMYTYTKGTSPIKINETNQLAKPEKYWNKEYLNYYFPKRFIFT